MSQENTKRIKVIQVFLLINGIFLLIWWPLSHWLYSDFYHQLLGFRPESYQDSMVKVIGTCGVVPVLLAFAAAKNPIRNRDAVIVLIVFGILISLTFAYLIWTRVFPFMELVNVGFSLISSLFLTLAYPWKAKYPSSNPS